MLRIILLAAVMLGLTACLRPCATRHVAAPQGEWHRISPDLLAEYGCGSFVGVASVDDMAAWCLQHGLGETATADVLPECAQRGTIEGCDFFWVCE